LEHGRLGVLGINFPLGSRLISIIKFLCETRFLLEVLSVLLDTISCFDKVQLHAFWVLFSLKSNFNSAIASANVPDRVCFQSGADHMLNTSYLLKVRFLDILRQTL
jgi:hypothetical protein